METRKQYDERYEAARERVKEIKGFYVHLLVYVLVNIFIIISSSSDESVVSALGDINNYFTVFFWGIGLLAHWAGVFGTGFFFNRSWEEKKIQEIMEQEKEERKKWE